MIKATNFIKTGIPWTPYAPIGWDIKRGKFVFKSIKEINSQMQCKDRLALTLKGVIDRYEGDNIGLNPSDLRTYQIFKPNELVFKLLDLDNKKTSRVGYVHKQGIMSSAYIRVLNNPEMNMRYFYYQYYDLYQRYIFNFIGQGVRATMSASDLLNIPILIPPLETQNAIVAYLDRKTQQIQEFIAKKERLIELLEEQKKSVISQELTNCKDELKLKYLLRIQNGDGIASDLIQNKDLYEVYGGNGVLGYYSKFNNSNETIIVGRVGALCGNVHYTNSDIWVNDNAMFVKTKHYYKYIFYLLKDANLNSLSFANAQPLITGTLVKNQTVKFEKDFNKQISIVVTIEKRLKTIDVAIGKAKTEIEKAKEYQESLITQVVTGQLKAPEKANANLEQNIELGMVAEANGVYRSKN